jgi:hypothetical protein
MVSLVGNEFGAESRKLLSTAMTQSPSFIFNKEKCMEETIDIMVGHCGSDDASFERELSFHGEPRDILAAVKRFAATLHNGHDIMEVVENEEGLPTVEFRPRGNRLAINQTVFATRKYKTHNFIFVGEQI